MSGGKAVKAGRGARGITRPARSGPVCRSEALAKAEARKAGECPAAAHKGLALMARGSQAPDYVPIVSLDLSAYSITYWVTKYGASLVDIAFRTRRLEKIFNSERELRRAFGERMVRVIAMRLAVLKAAKSLAMVPATRPERRHQLQHDRDGQYAVDLVHPHRLVFEPNHDPLPKKADGGIDIEQVNAITIIDVIDYHR